MKKILLGTSAVVGAALVASTASAQDPIQIGIGGALNSKIGTAWTTGGTESAHGGGGVFQDAGVNLTHDWILQFSGSTTLENGLTVGVFIELDEQGDNTSRNPANNDGTNEDDVRAFISGGFGTFLIGDLHPIADSTDGFYVDGGSGMNLSSATFEVAGNSSTIMTPLTDDPVPGEAGSLAYQTPTFAGFSGAVSYTPDLAEVSNGVSQADNDAVEEAWSFGVFYDNSFGAVDFSASGGVLFAQGEAGNNDHMQYNVGANIGFAGFTFGGGVQHVVEQAGGVGAYDEQFISQLGVSYSIDKVSVGVSGQYASGDVNTATTAGDTDRVWGVMLDGSYALGPGITWGAAFGMTSHNYSTAQSQANGGADLDINTYGLGTQLSISF